jgi:hypothetical protein
VKQAKPKLIFDLDGTLVDSCPGIGISLTSAFSAAGRTMPTVDLRAVIGPPIRVIATVSSRPSRKLSCPKSRSVFVRITMQTVGERQYFTRG